MAKQEYPPLKYVKLSNVVGHEFEDISSDISGNFTVEEFINYFLDKDFMELGYSGKFDSFNKHLIENIDTLAVIEGVKENEPFAYKTEFRDIYLLRCFTDFWVREKQVFKPDVDFLDALVSSETIEFSRFMLSHLPSKNFYIDLSEFENFMPIVGCFAFIWESTDSNMVTISLYLLSKDMITFSYYFQGEYNDRGILVFDSKDVYGTKDFSVSPKLCIGASYNEKDYEHTVERKDIILSCIKLIAYLCSREPELNDSSITKGTYKKSKTVRNKFSEVRIQDVGRGFGVRYRNYNKTLSAKSVKGSKGSKGGSSHHCHKFPAPHFRSGHWHRYWVGKGRTELDVKWIEPTFVGGSIATDVVVHNIR